MVAGPPRPVVIAELSLDFRVFLRLTMLALFHASVWKNAGTLLRHARVRLRCGRVKREV